MYARNSTGIPCRKILKSIVQVIHKDLEFWLLGKITIVDIYIKVSKINNFQYLILMCWQ